MSQATIVFLVMCLVVLAAYLVFYLAQWHEPGDPVRRTVLLCGIWGGFALALLLLVADTSWPGWCTDVSLVGQRGCPPVLGRELPWNDVAFRYGPETCGQLAHSRLGWTLMVCVIALVFLVLRARDSTLEAFNEQEELHERFRRKDRSSGAGPTDT